MPAVSPFKPGSVSVISSSTKFGGVTTIGLPLNKVKVQVSFSTNHFLASPTAFSSAAICSKVSLFMKCQNSPSLYKYARSVSITSAPSTDSPERKVFSKVLPETSLRILTRLNAWPLPGFTYSFSNMLQGSPSSIIFKPALNSLVLKLAICSSGIFVKIFYKFR